MSVSIPKKTVIITSLQLKTLEEIQKNEFKYELFEKLHKVKGNFRQKEIITMWNTFFSETKEESFFVAKLSVACSSGTYVRSIAHHLAKILGTSGIAYSILRTSIGNYTIKDSLRLLE